MKSFVAVLSTFALVSGIQSCCKTCPDCGEAVRVAKAVFHSGTSVSRNVSGTITFTSENGVTAITGTLTGLTDGKHGFHIHTYGDLTSCGDAAGHFNPYGKNHGGPASSERHVGDLGNIDVAGGVATVKIDDRMVALNGPNSVIGRMVVVHQGKDDLGTGGDEGSLTTGNAGARVACAVIGLAS